MLFLPTMFVDYVLNENDNENDCYWLVYDGLFVGFYLLNDDIFILSSP